MAFTPKRSVAGKNISAPTMSTRGIRIALILAPLAGCACFFLFITSAAVRQHPGPIGSAPPAPPAWISTVTLWFVLVPYVGCLFLLRAAREQKWIVIGAGIAFGFFGVLVLISPLMLGVMFLALGFSGEHGLDPGLAASAVALLVFIATSVWIAWSAARIGKNQKSFTKAFCGTGLYLFLAFTLWCPYIVTRN